MPGLTLEIRTAARSLARNPAFTVTALATLALGIGLTSAIFSLVEATLLRPLPFPDPSRLVQVWEAFPERGTDRNVVGPANYLVWRESARSFSQLAAIASWSVNLAGDGSAERASIAYVTSDFLPALGVAPILGRAFDDGDYAADAGDVALISEDLWRTRFAADPDVVGHSVTLNGDPTTIVGVLPRGADFPRGTQVWQPYVLGEKARTHPGRYLEVFGRLAPGVTTKAADAEMKGIAARLAKSNPQLDAGWSATVVPLAEQLFGDYRRALWVLFAATGVVLLLACANLAGLLLARNAGRSHELAVRGALGAGRSRLARQLFVECALVAVAGGALALAVLHFGLGAFRSWLPFDLPAFVRPEVDARVFLFALGATGAGALLFGLAPAWSGSALGAVTSLREGGERALGRRGHFARSSLVVVEVALALALVACAGLLVRSLTTLRGVDPGFRVDHLLTARISLTGAAYRDPVPQREFFSRLESTLARQPGIEAVGAISWLPLGGSGSATGYHALDRPEPEPGKEPVADVRMVTPGFFRSAAVRLVSGRFLDARDTADAPLTVVISESAARELWPGENAVGRELTMAWGDERPARVVGVVADLHVTGLDVEPRATLFWALPQEPSNFMSILVRTSGRPELAASTIRNAVAAIDPTIPAASLASMQEVIARGTSRQRFVSSLLLLFAGLGLTLAAIGLYGLLATSVAERRRELGVRLALGADARRLLAQVVGRGLRLVAIGVAVGAPVVYLVGRIVASLLYRTSPADPLTLVAAPLVLFGVAALACAAPAARAAHTDPARVLRSE